jgi:hypothetical protein
MHAKDYNEAIAALRAEVKRLRKTVQELTPALAELLKRRGFRVYKKEPADDLFLPEPHHIDSYYEMLKKYSFRLFVRDVIKHQPDFHLSQVTRYATKEVTAGYLEYLRSISLLTAVGDAYRMARGPIKSFGETLEWFVAEVFRQEFGAEALWGVKAKRPNVGGDYDLLAKIDNAILYMEVKSSPPKQIYQGEVSAFFDRALDLFPAVAVFFVDTELRMKDKIVPMFETECNLRAVSCESRRLQKEIFEVLGAGGERTRIFIMNAKDSIIQNIEKIMAAYYGGS